MDDDEFYSRIESYPIDEKINSLVALPYVDHTSGLSFQIAAVSLWDGDDLTVYERPDDFQTMSNARWEAVKDFEFEYLENLNLRTSVDFDFEDYKKRIKEIFSHYNDDKRILVLRALPLLDESRNEEYPDDILVFFFRKGFQAEGMWVRYEDYDDDHNILGKLLNQPNQDMGVNAGDTVKFAFTKDDDGNIICCSLLDE